MKPVRLLSLLTALLVASACDTGASNAPAAPPGALSITVDGSGYHPSTIHAPAGKPAQLVFTRTSDEGCGQQLVFPKLNLRKDLPLNEPVAVEITMPASGSIDFTCGMDMYRGSIVAQ